MRLVRVMLALLPLVVAGCVAGEAPNAATTVAPTSVLVDENRPEPVFNDIPNAQLGELAAPDANGTLLEPPSLREGEWWRIELHDTITDTTTQFVRVVARVEGDLYVFGMPHEGWWKEAVIFHTPAFGDVNRDLSHRAHDVPFQPLKFPLADGDSWETAWESADKIKATVKVESPTLARITFTGTNCGPLGLVGVCPNPSQGKVAELVYDATMHEVTEAVFPSHTWTVLEHGYGYEGWVTVPRAEHLVFFHGRLGVSAYDWLNAAPAGPTDLVKIDGGYNRVSFIIGVGNAVGTGAGGAYSEKVTAPDGKVFEMSQVPGGAFQVGFYEHAKVDGQWTLEHLAAGPGIVFTEGVAYHQYDIKLPDGSVRSDHSHGVVR